MTQAEPMPLEPVAAPYVGFRHWHVVGDRLCSVGRTVAIGEPVEYVEEDLSGLEISRR